MTVQLSTPDFQRLTRIVQNLPDFANVRDSVCVAQESGASAAALLQIAEIFLQELLEETRKQR